MWLRAESLFQTDSTGEALLDRETLLRLLHGVQARSIPLPAREREVQHARAGEHRSASRGRGVDYEESRPYHPGDDLRFMNWRLTARAGEPYMKVFREQRTRSRYVLVDRRGSMRFGTRVCLKVTQAAVAAAVAVFDALQQNSAVGGLLLERHGRWLSAADGESGAFAMARAAAAPCPPLDTTAGEPDLGRGLRQLLGAIEHGSSVVLISDFLDLDARHRRSLLQLAAEHEVFAVQVLDPAELQLPTAGRLQLTAPGGGKPLTVDTSNPAVRQDYADAADAQLERCRQLLVGAGVALTRLYTDDAPATVLDRVLGAWVGSP